MTDSSTIDNTVLVVDGVADSVTTVHNRAATALEHVGARPSLGDLGEGQDHIDAVVVSLGEALGVIARMHVSVAYEAQVAVHGMDLTDDGVRGQMERLNR